MKSKLLGITLFLLAVVPANASTTTYTDSAAYFAAAGHQTFQDFNSPISTTATSARYPDLLYTCTSSAFCTTSDGQGGLSVFVTTPGLATFTFKSPIKSFGISIISLGTISPGSTTLTVTNSNGFSANLFTDFSDPTCVHCTLDSALFGGLISTDSFTSVTFQGTEIGDGINFDNLYYGHSNAHAAPLDPVPLPAALPLFATGLVGLVCSAGAGRRPPQADRPGTSRGHPSLK